MKPYYVTKPDHNHESADVLTIGCPACILKVRSEQERERWASAPLRRTYWAFGGEGGNQPEGEFSVVLRVPVDLSEPACEVTERYQHEKPVIDAIKCPRFLVFEHDYEEGYGWEGFKSAHASMSDAEAETVLYSGHIVDLETLAIVRRWKNGWQNP